MVCAHKMDEEKEIKTLKIDKKGKITDLDGKVVNAIPVGEPILAYYKTELDGVNIVSDTNGWPAIPRLEDYYPEADAYIISSGPKVLEINHERKFDRIWLKTWTALQFYKIIDK